MSQNGSGNPRFNRLTVQDLEGNDAVVVHIATVDVKSFSGDYLSDNERKVVLTFAEYPAKEYVLNATSYNMLVSRLGDAKMAQFASWVGREIVLMPWKAQNPQTGAETLSVWVASAVVWNEAMRTVNPAPVATGKAARPRRK